MTDRLKLITPRLKWFMLGCAALVLVGAFYAARQREPSYRGVPLSRWLTALERSGGTLPDAIEAVRQIGPSGLPLMTNYLWVEDSAFADWLATLLDNQRLV